MNAGADAGETAAGRADQRRRSAAGRAQFPVAQLAPKPARPARVLIPPPRTRRPPDRRRRSSSRRRYGLGRVTVVAFDLDRSPFARLRPSRPSSGTGCSARPGRAAASAGGDGQNSTRYGTATRPTTRTSSPAALRTHVDTFDGVPVISFGWVALFIVLYILLIGPVEYLFLKKVLNRLELTWITFPLIVLTVSAAAYFTAYALKGNDLKINKVDVVDVDLAGGPGVRHDVVHHLQPADRQLHDRRRAGATGGRRPAERADAAGAGRLDGRRPRRRRRRHRQPAVHRTTPTRDAPSAPTGWSGVPIQVWSTKSFAAELDRRRSTAATAAGRRADLCHPPGDPDAAGRARSPTTCRCRRCRTCVLFYARQGVQAAGR